MGTVTRAIRGRRGQKLLRDLLAALDAMPEKRLIEDALAEDGEYCALGVVGAARGLKMDRVDPENSGKVAKLFDISDALARQIVFINDEDGPPFESPEQRWKRVRAWVARWIKDTSHV